MQCANNNKFAHLLHVNSALTNTSLIVLEFICRFDKFIEEKHEGMSMISRMIVHKLKSKEVTNECILSKNKGEPFLQFYNKSSFSII